MLRLFVTLCGLFISGSAVAQSFYVPSGGAPRSQVNLNFFDSGEYKMLNRLKSGVWVWSDNSGFPGPLDLDANGNPIYSATNVAHGGVKATQLVMPSQAQKPGNYVVTWTGPAATLLADQSGSSVGAKCTGVQSGGGNQTCVNSGCSTAQGYFVGTTLNITSPSSCNFVQGQPVSGVGVFANQFGTPTIITNTNGNTGIGAYTVNFSQTLGSVGSPITIIPGGRNEVTAGAENTTSFSNWVVAALTPLGGDSIANIGVYSVADEATYWTGEQFGTEFLQRLAQGNFGVIRDLNSASANASNCTTWATHKPASYYSYAAPEERASLYASTVTYNARTDTFSITFGSGNFADKQTIIGFWPSAGTLSSTVSLNGNAAVPIVGTGVTIGRSAPVSGALFAITYDATINSVLMFGGSSISTDGGLECGMPPEAFLQLNAEAHTAPWIVSYYLALDPMTDFYTQYAQYIKTNYPSMVPEFEVPDETWNEIQNPACYASAKTRVYISQNPAAWQSGIFYCGTGGDTLNWTGKVASTLGQALFGVYGDKTKYQLIVGVKTNNVPSSSQSAVLLSTSYINQTIPAQSGYTQTPAYQWGAAGVAVVNYWKLYVTGTAQEVIDAWCYFYQGTGCASRATIMGNEFATQDITGIDGNRQTPLATYYSDWATFASTCAGGSGCVPMTVRGYEGTFTNQLQGSDETIAVTSATNGNPCILNTTATNGAFPGMTVGLTNVVGGSWSASYSGFTVSAATANTISIGNLDCTSLGTLTSATLTYTGSANYVSYLRSNTYLAPQLYTDTLLNYASFFAANGVNPSQFTLGGLLSSGYPWTAWSPDIYGYLTLATCTACTVLGTTLTLGGTITGIFTPGQTIFGKFIAGIGNGSGGNTTILGSCSTSGPGPCGGNSGDTLAISQVPTQTISSGESMSGNATPSANAAGNSTTSPIQQWGAICHWNGNTNACNGGFLLNRDLSPASNDNRPVGIDIAA
jgi:hypothetical protein